MLPARKERGAGLLILLLFSLMIGLSALFALPGPRQTETTRASQAADNLTVAKAALIGYAASYREQVNPNRILGFLPCPDEDNDGAQEIVGPCSTSNTSVIGRLPYRTLGLLDLRDHTGECLWYVVSASHKATNITSPMNWDLRGNLRIVDAAGNVLADPLDADGGAVAAVIAPGPILAGQNRASGNFRCPGDNTNAFADWLENGASPAYVSPAPGTLELRQGAVGSSTGNDRIIWITARELFNPIARRNDLLANLVTQLTTCLDNTSITNSVPPTSTVQGTKNVAASAGIDEVRAARGGACAFAANSLLDNTWTNWKDHFRYAVCSDPATTCITVNAAACSGVLLFGGRGTTGSPRTAAQKVDATLAPYFEAPNQSALTSASTAFAGVSAYAGTAPAQDLAICLAPALVPPPPITLGGPVTITALTVGDGTLASLSGSTLTLGDADVNSSDAAIASLFGCAWVGNPRTFGNGLRAYFRYEILTQGQGFVFTVVDSDRNPLTNMCGAGGRHLGYAGLPDPGFNPIRYPKIGLEIDTRDHGAYNGDPSVTGSGKNESDDNHMAIVFWGQHDPTDVLHAASTYAYDDNVHGEPIAAQPVAPSTFVNPVNPAFVSTGVFSDSDIKNANVIRHVRLEIARAYAAGSGTYTIKAWIDFNLAAPAGFADTTVDYPAAATISTVATIPDLSLGTEAFRNFRLGFTNSAGSTGQVIEITNFEARVR